MAAETVLSPWRTRAVVAVAAVASSTFAATAGATRIDASLSETTYPAKLQVLRAGVRDGRLDLLAELTKRADGDRVRISFTANGERLAFTARVEDGRIRFRRRLPAFQRRISTGILELDYPGSARVRPAAIRLRAANTKANLKRNFLSLADGTISARGSLTQRASGIIRLNLSYEQPDGSPGEWQSRARIREDGSWRLSKTLPAEARAGGYLSIQFTGNYSRRIRGEQIAKQLIAGQRLGDGAMARRKKSKSAPSPVYTPTEPPPSQTTPPAPVSNPGGVLFFDGFAGSDGIITSADAYWNPNDATLARDPNWEGESGTMYRQSETAVGTVSSWFRFWTTRSDFGDVRVEMDLRTSGFGSGSLDSPARDWDGVKIWLRRQVVNGSSSANVKPALYTSEVNRRQGNVIIQKKCDGRDDYAVLANTSWNGNPNPPRFGQWERVGGAVHTNPDGSVTIQVIRDGMVVLTANDAGGGGCSPITSPGKVGVRAENTEFRFDNFTVTSN